MKNEHRQKLKLSLVAPVFNEQSVSKSFMTAIDQVFDEEVFISLEIIFINDGSTDATLDELLMLQQNDSRIVVIDLSRNFGKEAAISAGLQIASGDVVVPIDIDLQDPPSIILEMIKKWRDGYEVVLAKRINRDSDSWFKRAAANFFYKAHNQLSNLQIPDNVGDFRLMDRKVIEALKQLPETSRFMKGLFAWVGYKTTTVEYVRPKRVAGNTKFTAWKLWNFALEGLTSFSTVPLRVWTYLGILTSLTSLVFAIYILGKVVISGVDVPGYASLMVAVTLLGGLQLIGIGVLGEYLGRTYIESKRRPVFLVRQVYGLEDQ